MVCARSLGGGFGAAIFTALALLLVNLPSLSVHFAGSLAWEAMTLSMQLMTSTACLDSIPFGLCDLMHMGIAGVVVFIDQAAIPVFLLDGLPSWATPRVEALNACLRYSYLAAQLINGFT